jgi:hypothetical protein
LQAYDGTGLSVKYLTPDIVVKYMMFNHLYALLDVINNIQLGMNEGNSGDSVPKMFVTVVKWFRFLPQAAGSAMLP